MKTTLAILAHAQALPTIHDFLPRWKSLGVPVVGCLPESDPLDGVFDETIHVGESAHAGFKVFRRFLDTLCALLDRYDSNRFVVAEYDTVNLRPEFPKFDDSKLVANLVAAPPHNMSSGAVQLCALSPWCFPRDLMGRFLVCGNRSLAENPDPPEFCGLLDRWIGHVLRSNKIPAQMGFDMDGYPWYDGSHERIRRMNINWIHGWKRKEDFKELWTM